MPGCRERAAQPQPPPILPQGCCSLGAVLQSSRHSLHLRAYRGGFGGEAGEVERVLSIVVRANTGCVAALPGTGAVWLPQNHVLGFSLAQPRFKKSILLPSASRDAAVVQPSPSVLSRDQVSAGFVQWAGELVPSRVLFLRV